MTKRQYFAVKFANEHTQIMCAESIYELMHNLAILHDVCDDEVVSIRKATNDEQYGYEFDDFVEHLNATLARLHSIESCDNDYCVSFDDNDVQSVLACTFATMLKIDYDKDMHKYIVNRAELFEAFKEDKYAMKNLLDTFNTIMNRFNVVMNHEYAHKYEVQLV